MAPSHGNHNVTINDKDQHFSQRGQSKFVDEERARLHQASASTLRQLSDDACDFVLIENNGVAPEWGCNLFSSNSTDFNENRIARVVAALMLTLGVNGD